MQKWSDIQYRDFYDVPRIVVARQGEELFLFRSRFDDSNDEYVDYYEVYRMPVLAADELNGSWVGLEQRALAKLENIPLDGLPFSVTRRGVSGNDNF